MKLKRDEIKTIVIESLYEFANESNLDELIIDEKTDPIYHLGLDSMDGVEYACILSEKLDFEIPDNVNPFVNDEQKRGRSVDEIVDFLFKLASNKLEKNDE